MAEVNLLKSLPRTPRNVNARVVGKTPEIIRLAKEFGEAYFDGAREYGYGGYRYDGRWVSVARDIVDHFGLKAGDRVLDIGCAKGFLVKDLMTVCPGLDVYGIDISRYAISHCEAEAAGRLYLGSADDLPFADNSFAAALAINSIHNLPRARCVQALREIERVAPGRAYVQVDSYYNETERALFLDWMLTAETHGYPENWYEIFKEAGYSGDWYWTFV